MKKPSPTLGFALRQTRTDELVEYAYVGFVKPYKAYAGPSSLWWHERGRSIIPVDLYKLVRVEIKPVASKRK